MLSCIRPFQEPTDPSFSPDGGYVPRVFFLAAATQKVDPSIYNVNGNKEYKYFYYETEDLLDSMKKAVNAAAQKTELWEDKCIKKCIFREIILEHLGEALWSMWIVESLKKSQLRRNMGVGEGTYGTSLMWD